MPKVAIRFFHVGGYRRFCWHWWKDIAEYVFGGWYQDIKTYWHRARYGWAPRDVWSLDNYLAGVLAGSLEHLAKTTHGAPFGYPNMTPHVVESDTDHEKWEADLRRWAKAFHDYAEDEDFWYSKEVRDALLEIAPWFGSMWD